MANVTQLTIRVETTVLQRWHATAATVDSTPTAAAAESWKCNHRHHECHRWRVRRRATGDTLSTSHLCQRKKYVPPPWRHGVGTSTVVAATVAPPVVRCQRTTTAPSLLRRCAYVAPTAVPPLCHRLINSLTPVYLPQASINHTLNHMY